VRIDPDTEDVQAQIPVPVVPGWLVGGGGLTVADGRVWVAGRTFDNGQDGGMVVTIDPATDRLVDRFDLAGPVADVAADGSAAWALADGGTVSRIDPSTGEVTARIPLEGNGRSLALVDGALFAMIETGEPSYGSALYRIDPTANDIAGKDVMDSYGVLASAENGVWVSVGDSLRNLDPEAGSPWLATSPPEPTRRSAVRPSLMPMTRVGVLPFARSRTYLSSAEVGSRRLCITTLTRNPDARRDPELRFADRPAVL